MPITDRLTYPDQTFDPRRGPLLGSPNRLKLAVFCANTERGTTVTHAPEALKLTWPNSLSIARAVDESGIEAIIPLARWRKPKTTTPDVDRIYETFTWAAAVAAVTRNVQVFATFHLPFFHPVLAAKMVATADHISGGRFALNVVAGWNSHDFAMLGSEQREHDDRYAVAAEWMEYIEKIWREHEPFDFQGQFYQGKGVLSQPKPIQKGRPVVMSAGSSPAGQKFARRWADINFAAIEKLEDARRIVSDAKQSAREIGREVGVYTSAWIVCRETEREAQDYVKRVIDEMGDYDQANAVVAEMTKNSLSIDAFSRKTIAQRSMAGFYALPLVGTAEQIVSRLEEISDTGIDGLAISWVDYEQGLAQYKDKLLPLMIQAGLRVK
jgi:alkanesulfonate monooxygenase SsuD/methylene tetrahydromethanopterin reductase-like flavin-dependent oxidoreductase (luciferase family)